MKCIPMIVLAAFMSIACTSCATDGLISVKSPYPVHQTVDRLEAGTEQRGLKVFARIDHAAGATSVGKTLRPTELLIFGNPLGGTPLMHCAQTAGIDFLSRPWRGKTSKVRSGSATTTLVTWQGVTASPPVRR